MILAYSYCVIDRILTYLHVKAVTKFFMLKFLSVQNLIMCIFFKKLAIFWFLKEYVT